MTQLGCNYSPQLISLVDQGAVEVEWIKISKKDTVWKEISICNEYAPMLLHTLPHATLTTFENIDFDDINRAIKACKSPHVALHLQALKEDWNNQAEISDTEIFERM
ncbi:hypothetical protein [Cohnella luojiensis]|uniref:Uncharacterized protein n=1 Tax=Cohnella luojiensis TaxID=652876 RepID=A0A4Y8LS27_9BACL|nr:hypothetical protein [Cohnella luojiensis]TFE19118.1 hypothetical protein E2980_23755 [Cohnella luojiensis]